MTHAHTHADHASPTAHHRGHDEAVQAEILDLDAEVMAEHHAAVIGWLPLREAPGQVVDLGAGTGTGTFALLDRFPHAQVTAVDASAGHLERLRDKAHALGVASRVNTVQVDLDTDDWPDLGSPDLVWASASMHHMAHPDRVLRTVHNLLSPGGLLAVVELAGFPRFLPENAPEDRPGLEQRCHEAGDRLHSQRLPHRGADWGPLLVDAGFTVDGHRTVAVNIDGTRDGTVGRYALGSLTRMRHSLADALLPEDLDALDRLLDTESPHSILRRADLTVRTKRTVWAARRTG